MELKHIEWSSFVFQVFTMALAPHCLGHGSYKPVHPSKVVVSARTMRIVVSCSSGTLHNEEKSNGSEATSSEQHKSLGEQLRLLNLEILSKRVLGTRVASNRLEYFEIPVKNNSQSPRQQHKGGTRRASSNPGVVGQVLDM